MSNTRKFETQAIRTQVNTSREREHSVPIYATSSYIFDNAEDARMKFAEEREGNVYSRYSNPNNDEFINKLCLLEEAEDGVSTASGMAAIFLGLMSFLKTGDHVLACRNLFGSTHQVITQILPRWGITFDYLDINSTELWHTYVNENTRLLLIETPSNPGLDLIDLQWTGNFCKQHKLIYMVDNCFATPYLQAPARYGADIICHSATKFIDGQGRTLGGAVLGKAALIKEVRTMARQTGPAMSPFNGWLLSKSLETLAVRMDRHCSNALELAKFLEQHPKVAWVKYPFLPSHPQHELARKQMRLGGGLVSFEPKGGLEAGINFLDHLKIFSLSSNLGDTRSIVTHPATTTHSKLSEQERQAVNITPGMVRLSVGLENISDIIQDADQALNSL